MSGSQGCTHYRSSTVLSTNDTYVWLDPKIPYTAPASVIFVIHCRLSKEVLVSYSPGFYVLQKTKCDIYPEYTASYTIQYFVNICRRYIVSFRKSLNYHL